MPRNVCTYQQYQNLLLILVVLHKFDFVFPFYSHEYPVGITCNGASDICWNNMCSKCKDAAKFRELYVLKETDKNKCCTWYQWEKVVGGNGKEYLQKVEIKGRVDDLYSTLLKSLSSFLMHYFIKQ